jgi:hypothetical protein
MGLKALLLPPLHLRPEHGRPRRQRLGRYGRGFWCRRFHRHAGREFGQRRGELQAAFQTRLVAGPVGGDEDFLFGGGLVRLGLLRPVLQGDFLPWRRCYSLFEIAGITEAHGARRARPSPKRKTALGVTFVTFGARHQGA